MIPLRGLARCVLWRGPALAWIYEKIQRVTIMQLDKLLEQRKFRYFDRVFDRETEHLIESYQPWLICQRYSSRTTD
jgi:hypothetical protein